ncbi:MAG TPA: class II aldolase/adducin family protein [Chthonomonadales bacterium]|nr:class II aldolase/adducin family protein [Chthonomonadales bacterium]
MSARRARLECRAERREVARFLRRLYRMRLTTTTGGNVSCRTADGSVAITPSGADKARVRAADVALLSADGALLTPGLEPSSEGSMHVRIYARCPEVRAIVHAHPPVASVFACADTPIDLGLLCETHALLDEPIVTPYARSGTAELAEVVAESAARSSCIIMRSHAVVTTGATLLQAFSRLELLEEAARATLIARQLDGVRRLTAEQRAELDRLVGRTGPDERPTGHEG